MSLVKKNILIASFDLNVGGVERSLISMLNQFNYDEYNVDLMLYRHDGEFMDLLPIEPNLLKELPHYATFRKSIKQVLSEKYYSLGTVRLLSKFIAMTKGKMKALDEQGYYQMQLMWKYSLPFLPALDKEYDVAISYLWPHYFVGDKVKAKKKIAWIHTDYSTVYTDVDLDCLMWHKFDHIISISPSCTEAFLHKYPSLSNKIVEVENITSPAFVKDLANEWMEELVQNEHDFNLVSVGRLCFQKGFDLAIQAMKLLVDNGYENIKWYVVGSGEEEAHLERSIKELGLEKQFILVGKKVNPYPYIKHCDLYVQPSRYEGKAVAVLEAQILEKPVLITNYPTASSQVTDGIDGVITELSVEGIASGIEKMLKNLMLREGLSKNNKETDFRNSTELEKLYKLF